MGVGFVRGFAGFKVIENRALSLISQNRSENFTFFFEDSLEYV